MSSILTDSIRRFVGNDSRPAEGDRNARVLAVCSQKGGVGKTTTAVSIAAGLAEFHDQRVLLVDMDPQGHCATALEATVRGRQHGSLGEVLLSRRRDVQELAMPTLVDGLWVVPSDKDLASTEEIMTGRIGKEMLLRQAMRVARTHYDAIVLDCPPNLGTLGVNALAAADWALIPCDMSALALEGVDDLVGSMETLAETLDHDLGVLGILRTRVDGRNQRMNEDVDAQLRDRYGPHVLEATVPVNTRLAHAQSAGEPVFRHDPDCRGSHAYRALLDEIAPVLGLS